MVTLVCAMDGAEAVARAAVTARIPAALPINRIFCFPSWLGLERSDLDMGTADILLPGQQEAFQGIDPVVEQEAHEHQDEQPDPDGVEVIEAGRRVDDVAEAAL